MSSVHLTATEAQAIERILSERSIKDPVGLVQEVGYDAKTFFENHDWSFMDFRGSDLDGISFRGAILFSISIWEDQVSLIEDSLPRLFEGTKVFPRQQLPDEDKDEESTENFVFQNLEPVARKILVELQSDGRMTNVELSKRVGLSTPPCLRRVRTLEEEGLIVGYHTDVDNIMLGFEFKAIVFISLADLSEDGIERFEESCRTWPLVRKCYLLNGEVDFILECVALDEASFQEFIENVVKRAEGVVSVKVNSIVRTSKEERGPPLEHFLDNEVENANSKNGSSS